MDADDATEVVRAAGEAVDAADLTVSSRRSAIVPWLAGGGAAVSACAGVTARESTSADAAPIAQPKRQPVRAETGKRRGDRTRTGALIPLTLAKLGDRGITPVAERAKRDETPAPGR